MTQKCQLAALGTIFLAAAVAAGEPPAFRYERPVSARAGPNRLDVDVALLSGALPGLADLRFFTSEGLPVPYLLVPPETIAPEWLAGTVFPVSASRDLSGFEIDLGRAPASDRLRVEGLRAPFLKRFALEGSGDRTRWTTLVAEGTLFDLPDEDLRATEVGFARGEYRYLRLLWDDHATAHMQLPRAAFVRLAAGPPPPPPLLALVAHERRASEPGRSRFRIRLPGRHLPIAALILDIAPGHILRTAEAGESRPEGGEMRPYRLGRGTLRRAGMGDLVAEDLRLPITPPEASEIDLVVEDGANPPLDLRAVQIELRPQPWIYFESGDAASLIARYGAPRLTAEHYDLEAVRDALPRLQPAAAAWGTATASTVAGASPSPAPLPELGPAIDLAPFRFVRELAPSPAGLTTLALDAAVLAHSNGLADLRVVDAAGRQVPYLIERRDEPLALDLPALEPLPAGPSGVTGVSRYRLRLPFATLPAARLVLSTQATVFERALTLEAERPPRDARSGPWVEVLAQRTWRNTDPETAPVALVFDLPPSVGELLMLRVDEGDNAPLPLAPPRLLLPAVSLRFFRPAGDSVLRLAYGNDDLAAPRYDVALLREQVLESRATEATLRVEAATTQTPKRDFGRTAFWVVLVVAVITLLGLLARLLRGGASEGKG